MPMPTTSPGCDRRGIELLERLVDDERIAEVARRGGRQHVEPARRDDADAERHVARIDQVHVH